MTTLKKDVALLGAGTWGKNIARNLSELGVLHTLCDSNEDLLNHYKDLYPGTEVCVDVRDVFENTAITRIFIAAPAFQHFTLARLALLSGKDVYVEKPLCMDPREAEELIHLAERHQRVLMVGHLLHYHPCVRKIKQMVMEGELGRLQYIASHRLNLGAFRTEENALWNFAPHDISVILSLCGGELPQSVRCVGEAYVSPGIVDTSMTTLRFEGDLRAHIYVSWLNPYKEQRLVVLGSKGILVFDDTLPWEQKLMHYPEHIQWTQGTIPQHKQQEGIPLEVPFEEPLRCECLHFLECCEKRTAPLTDGMEGLRVLQVLNTAQASMDEEGTAKDPRVTLGDGVMVQDEVNFKDGVICEDGVLLENGVAFTANPDATHGKTLIKKGATIGANATITCGVEIGEYSYIAGGAVVTGNVKPFALMAGHPARQEGWISRYGKRLPLPVDEEALAHEVTVCPHTGDVYALKEGMLRLASQGSEQETFMRQTKAKEEEINSNSKTLRYTEVP